VRIYIKENSVIARIAAWKMKSGRIAVVIGKTIHLHNISREEFIENRRWVSHELEHIRQYRRYGLIPFIIRYLIESARSGYHNNKYEIAARNAERED
jgi:hypothetical protein